MSAKRKKLIAGNWKMYKTPAETAAHLRDFKTRVRDALSVDIAVAPPFICLPAAAGELAGSNIMLAAQNMHWESEGAYTGEISAKMLIESGCKMAIIGHSERRKIFLETDEMVAKKTAAAIKAGLVPIVCVGETLEERERGDAFGVIGSQLKGGLGSVDSAGIEWVVIAYEPVWAIGTGKNATPAQAQEVHAFIRGEIEKKYGAKVAAEMQILYGGSVKPDNAGELVSQADIDGALVGGASLKPADFAAIVQAAVPQSV